MPNLINTPCRCTINNSIATPPSPSRIERPACSAVLPRLVPCRALAHLASASGVARERDEFMELVEKEIGRCVRVVGLWPMLVASGVPLAAPPRRRQGPLLPGCLRSGGRVGAAARPAQARLCCKPST